MGSLKLNTRIILRERHSVSFITRASSLADILHNSREDPYAPVSAGQGQRPHQVAVAAKVTPPQAPHQAVVVRNEHAQSGGEEGQVGGAAHGGSVGEVAQLPQLHGTSEGGGASNGVSLRGGEREVREELWPLLRVQIQPWLVT